MSDIGAFPIAEEGLPSTTHRGRPVVAITAPGATVTSPLTTVSWTYTSPVSSPQVRYRIEFLIAGAVVYDSGWIASAATSASPPFSLTAWTQYQVRLTVADVNNDEGQTLSSFQAVWDLAALAPTNPQVGAVYEVAINGVGYMLNDRPGSEMRHERSAGQLQSQRFATGDTPFSEAIDRYVFVGHSDWTGGEGQNYLNRPASDASRYFYSEGLNPFDQGELKLLPAVAQVAAPATASGLLTVAGGVVFHTTDATTGMAGWTPGGSSTTWTQTGGTITALASDGANWYSTDGSNVYRNTSAADGSVWSTLDLPVIEWCGDRLAGFYDDFETFTTVAPDGTEETPGGIRTIENARLCGLSGGDGHIWFGVNRPPSATPTTGRGEVRVWNVSGGAGDDVLAATLPEGELVLSLYYYLGNLFVASTDGASTVRIYRGVVNGDSGAVMLEAVVEYESDEAAMWQRRMFAGAGNLVAFAWPTMTRAGQPGVGVINLSTGGYARWHQPAVTVTDGPVGGVVALAGDFVFTVVDGGVWAAGPIDGDGTLRETGFLETSTADLASGAPKLVESLLLAGRPLAGEFEAEWSADSNDSWVTLGSVTAQGVTSTELPIQRTVMSVGLRLKFKRSATLSSLGPILRIAQLKMLPQGLADEIVTFPIHLVPRRKGLHGQELVDDVYGTPAKVYRAARLLAALTGRSVTVQDVDWPHLEITETMTVVGVQRSGVGVKEANTGKRADDMTVVVQLRKAVS